MWKLLVAIISVAGLLMFGNADLSVPHIPYAVMVLPAVIAIFATGLFFSQR